MAYTIIALFSLAALLGISLLTFVLLQKEIPKGLAIIHGMFAATALVLLIIYAFYKDPSPITSIVLFILAAFMGFFLFYKDLTTRKPPKWLALLHGATAICAFIFLLINIFGASL